MKKILVVEDEEKVQELIRFALEEEGYEVISAENGETGLEMARSAAPDLILLDVLLPGINGFEVCRSLKSGAEFKSIPVLMITALDDVENKVNGFSAGADDYVSKPFNLIELLSRIKSHLRTKDLYDIVKTDEEEKSALLDISRALSSASGPNETLYLIVSKIAGVMEVKRCSIIYIDPQNKHGFVMASHDSREIKHLEIDLDKYPEIKKVKETGEPVIINDVCNDPILFSVRDALNLLSIKSIMAFPIAFKEAIIGTLILRTSRREKAFNDREIRFCSVIAHLSAAPLKNAYAMEMLNLEKEHERKKRLAAEEKNRFSRELLKTSEERYRTLIDNSPVCICHISLEGKLVYMNPAGRRFHGIENLEDIPGMDYAYGLKKEYQGGMKDALEKAKKGETTKLECMFITAGGKEKWLECAISPVKNAKGEVESLLRISTDITERKQMEKALTEKTIHLDNILRSSTNMAIAATDMDFRIIYYNPVAENIFGYTAEEVIGHTVMEMHTKEKVDHARFERAIEIVKKEGEYLYYVNRKGKAGIRYIESRVTGIWDKDGNLAGFVLMSLDITERRREDEAQARLFEELKAAKLELEKANAELLGKMEELERFHKVTMDREERIIQLKNKVRELEEREKKSH
ncbi:MAG: PAS domain S-box protein [Nitrospinae bacterium]|nr:PAS domain S-box protein [Nitrospinota bacterium]